MLAWSAWVLAATAVLGGLGACVALSQVSGRAGCAAALARHGCMAGWASPGSACCWPGSAARHARSRSLGRGRSGWWPPGSSACAVLLGLAVFAARLRRRPPSTLALGVHATLAVGGLVMLAAYLSA